MGDEKRHQYLLKGKLWSGPKADHQSGERRGDNHLNLPVEGKTQRYSGCERTLNTLEGPECQGDEDPMMHISATLLMRLRSLGFIAMGWSSKGNASANRLQETR